MNLRKILGLKSAQEKISEYRDLKRKLASMDLIGKQLSDRFMLQKSIIDDSNSLPTEKRGEILGKYSEFLKEHQILYLYLPDEGVWIFVIVKCEYTPADGDAFLLGTQEEVPTLLLSTCGTDASKRLVIWCEKQEEKAEQIFEG